MADRLLLVKWLGMGRRGLLVWGLGIGFMEMVFLVVGRDTSGLGRDCCFVVSI